MKRLLVSMMVLGFVASLAAFAEDDKAAKPATDKPVVEKAAKTEAPAKDITVTGKISKEVKKEGEKEKVKYILTTADGQKITLPEVKAEVADLEKMVGKDVKVVGKGKEDGKKVHLKSVTSVALAEAPVAVPAPAKDAPAPVKEAPAPAK